MTGSFAVGVNFSYQLHPTDAVVYIGCNPPAVGYYGWTNIMYCLRECLDGVGGAGPSGSAAPSDVPTTSAEDDASSKRLSEIFGIGLETTLESTETNEKSTETSEAYALKCNITSDINYVHEGLKLGLQEDREKRSVELDRDVLFKGQSQISRLPRYLTVQMVRFFYKQDVKQKAKIELQQQPKWL